MPSSPSSSAQAARQRLGGKLRAMRDAAKLSGRQFAELAGWADATNVTKIEKGQRTITAAHVDLWCDICGVPQRHRDELLTEQANVAGMWETWKQVNRAGLAATQRRLRSQYDEVRLHRAYLSNMMHGLLQAPGYMTTALEAVRLDQGLQINDVDEAVAERLDRQKVLRRPDARWVFVLEGQTLWHRLTTIAAHREQLEHLLDLVVNSCAWPSVSLGIIPPFTDRTRDGVHGIWPEESFFIFDTTAVQVELISGHLTLTQPDEVAAYITAWDRLFNLAVRGGKAAALIFEALAALPADEQDQAREG